MIIFSQRQFYNAVKLISGSILSISCLTLLSACNAQEVTDESTIGSNNAAQTNPAKIERNSMEEQTDISNTSEDSRNTNSETTSADK